MNNNNKSPFCKVCFDSGKPDTKHWVKDRAGKVCCPTLLALKCRLCGQCGHTVKYCSKAQPTAKAVAPTYKAQQAPVVQQSKPEPKNKFDLLFNDESDDEQEPEQKQTSPAEKPAVVVKRWVDYDTDSDDEQQPEPQPQQKQASPSPDVKRWADYDTDSDDEDVPLSIPLPKPTLKRYGYSDNSDDSLIEQESM